MKGALLGILVGGRARRMGGVPKGLLTTRADADGASTLVERVVSEFRRVASGAPVVLVGRHPAYVKLGLPQIDDDPKGVGPLGGLAALLREGRRVRRRVVVVACDMAQLNADLFGALLGQAEGSVAVAPFRDGRWEPLFSAFEPDAALPVLERRLAQRLHSLKGFLDALGCTELELSGGQAERLEDWDTPEQVEKAGGGFPT